MSDTLTIEKLNQMLKQGLPPRFPPTLAYNGSYNGFRVVTSALLTETVRYPRSPARAKRRMRRGFRQHYASRPMQKVFQMPDGTLVMHPRVWADMLADAIAPRGREGG